MTLPPDSHRGGVLTMASVLKVTANGTTTSPVLRGAWVLDRILGTPPPQPPADVPAVEPDIRGATTIREQLAKHRQIGVVRELPRQDRSAGIRAGELRRHRRLARALSQRPGTGEAVIVDGRRMPYHKGPTVDPADVLPDGRRVREHRRVQAIAAAGQGPARPRLDREAADLRHRRGRRRPPIEARDRGDRAARSARRITACGRWCTRSCRARCFRRSDAILRQR